MRALAYCLLAVAALSGLGLVTSCVVATDSLSGRTGSLNILLTDAPADDWQEVSVLLKSISLYNRDSRVWQQVWAADPANAESGRVNLVDLSGVALILAQATIPEGTYNRLKMVINTNPSTMKLVDDSGNVIDPSLIRIVNSVPLGEVRVDLDPAVTVTADGTANLQVDFDLAHPLSIVNLNGVIWLNFQLRHKPLPHKLFTLQFARSIGQITAAAADGTNFTIKTLNAAEITFNVNSNTIYVDADTRQPGSFSGLAALAGTGYALVASNMNADGSLFARRVWYSASVDALPRFTPEGIVRRVGENWIRVMKQKPQTVAPARFRCDWNAETIFIDENTAWKFRGDVHMGAGLGVLQFIKRGFRVEVTLVDPSAAMKVAAEVNVLWAHEEGAITAVSETGITMGWWGHATHTLPYSAVENHGFSWWYFGLPWTASTNVQDFIDTVNQALNARLWVFAMAGLYWDELGGGWAVEHLVLAPEKLAEPTAITTGYSADTGTMDVTTYCWWDAATPQLMTIHLDATGDFQTVVGSFSFNTTTKVLSVTFPVNPSDWPALLTPALPRVQIWVRPVKGSDGTFTWHAYTVLAYQLTS
jgi:hypothetical protein